MVYLDANVFVFAALANDELGEAARNILANLSKIKARTCCLTMNELAWAVLQKSDTKTATENCNAVMSLQNLDVTTVKPSDVWGMTREMKKQEMKPRDALHLTIMKRLGERKIISGNKHFDKTDVERIPIKTYADSI